MGETGRFKVKDLDELDVPVDKQIASFTIYTGVLKFKSGKFPRMRKRRPAKKPNTRGMEKSRKNP